MDRPLDDTQDMHSPLQVDTEVRLLLGRLGQLVSANDEPYWIALQANNVSLFASKSDGVGVPDSGGVSVNDAIAGLTGSAQSGGVLINGGQGSPGVSSPFPTPSPSAPPSPSPSPRASPR